MIDRRMNKYVKRVNKPISIIVISRLFLLIINTLLLLMVANNIYQYYLGNPINLKLLITIITILVISNLIIYYLIGILSDKCSSDVKLTLRHELYNKIKSNYQLVLDNKKRDGIIQLAVEGINQLEQYFANYLPQFFYAMLAPLFLLILYFFLNPGIGAILFISVWLMPIIIALSQIVAKKIMSKYWNKYIGLGLDFLENLSGLLTLKLFNADKRYQEKMDESAEGFRIATMKVLVMQLNSVSVMELVTYLGTGIGIFFSLYQFNLGKIDLFTCLFTIFISIEFFLPMRLLGSFFHVAMNGISASKNLDQILSSTNEGKENIDKITTIEFKDAYLGYKDNVLINGLNLSIKPGLLGICGKSGSGKTTLYRSLLNPGLVKDGQLLLNGNDINNYDSDRINDRLFIMRDRNFIFNLTIRENLLMVDQTLTDEQMIKLLEKVGLNQFASSGGLDYLVAENASNLSGGEQQRLVFLQGLIANKDIYIFDEAISSVDVETENVLINLIQELSKEKIILLISHRLTNITNCDQVLFIESSKWTLSDFDQLKVNNVNFNTLLTTQLQYETIKEAGC